MQTEVMLNFVVLD